MRPYRGRTPVVVVARSKLKLPELEGDPDSAIRAFADLRFREALARRGAEHGLKYAEQFHHIGPDTALAEFVAKNAVALE